MNIVMATIVPIKKKYPIKVHFEITEVENKLYFNHFKERKESLRVRMDYLRPDHATLFIFSLMVSYMTNID